MSVFPMCITTLSRAVARPFSYVVCPVEVISIGAFSGVFNSPCIQPAVASRPAIKKTSDRMAKATVLHQSPPAKLKPLTQEINRSQALHDRAASKARPNMGIRDKRELKCNQFYPPAIR